MLWQILSVLRIFAKDMLYLHFVYIIKNSFHFLNTFSKCWSKYMSGLFLQNNKFHLHRILRIPKQNNLYRFFHFLPELSQSSSYAVHCYKMTKAGVLTIQIGYSSCYLTDTDKNCVFDSFHLLLRIFYLK